LEGLTRFLHTLSRTSARVTGAGREKISGGRVATGGDGLELLEFSKEILDHCGPCRYLCLEGVVLESSLDGKLFDA
jgi:hypothetical protein